MLEKLIKYDFIYIIPIALLWLFVNINNNICLIVLSVIDIAILICLKKIKITRSQPNVLNIVFIILTIMILTVLIIKVVFLKIILLNNITNHEQWHNLYDKYNSNYMIIYILLFIYAFLNLIKMLTLKGFDATFLITNIILNLGMNLICLSERNLLDYSIHSTFCCALSVSHIIFINCLTILQMAIFIPAISFILFSIKNKKEAK